MKILLKDRFYLDVREIKKIKQKNSAFMTLKSPLDKDAKLSFLPYDMI
jgi:hypothetical protein